MSNFIGIKTNTKCPISRIYTFCSLSRQASIFCYENRPLESDFHSRLQGAVQIHKTVLSSYSVLMTKRFYSIPLSEAVIILRS